MRASAYTVPPSGGAAEVISACLAKYSKTDVISIHRIVVDVRSRTGGLAQNDDELGEMIAGAAIGRGFSVNFDNRSH